MHHLTIIHSMLFLNSHPMAMGQDSNRKVYMKLGKYSPQQYFIVPHQRPLLNAIHKINTHQHTPRFQLFHSVTRPPPSIRYMRKTRERHDGMNPRPTSPQVRCPSNRDCIMRPSSVFFGAVVDQCTPIIESFSFFLTWGP